MQLLKQSQTAQALVFLMIDSTDHLTGKTGLTPTVTLSKNGGAFAAPAGAVSEIANGWYKIAGNATDTATLGALVLHATSTGADPVDIVFEVVAFDPQVAYSTYAGGAVASVTGAVGSVAGNVGGNVVGSVASVTADVGITQAAADKVWGSASRTLSSFGTLVADIAAAVWGAASRTLSAFGFTVNTNANATETAISAAVAGVQSSLDALPTNGVGAYTITIATSVPGARMRITQGITVKTATADNSGNAVLPLDGGAWAINVTSPGYQGYIGTFTVAGNATETIAMTQIVITPPTNPDLCKVYGYFKKPDQSKWVGLKIRLTLKAPLPTSAGAIIASRMVELVTDVNGEIGTTDANTVLVDRNDYITPAGTAWRVGIDEANVNATITLNSDLFDLASLVV